MSVLLTVYDQGGNAEVLDLYPGDTISLNYKFNDLKELTGSSNFTREFRIPANKTNSRIFGYQHELTYINTGNQNIRRKFTATLSVDTIPIITGYVQFKSAIVTNNQVADYNIVFFGETADVLATLKDKYLSEVLIPVESIPNTVPTIDYTVINEGNIYTYDFSDQRLKFAVIDKGFKLAHTGIKLVDNNPIGEFNLTPCFSIKFLIDLINNQLLQQGKKIVLSTLIDKHLQQVYIPYANEFTKDGYIYDELYNPDFNAVFSLGIFTTHAITSWVPITINGVTRYSAVLPNFTAQLDEESGLDATGRIYTFTFNTLAKIAADFRVQADGIIGGGLRVYFKVTSGATTYMLSATWDNSFIDFTTIDQTTGATIFNTLYDPSTPNDITGTTSAFCAGTPNAAWQFYAGDTVEVLLVANFDVAAAGKTVYITNQASNLGFNTAFFMNDIVTTSAPYFIRWEKMAPEYLLTDLINDVLKAHNGVFVPDKNNPNIVNLVSMVEYLDSGNIDDWTDLINIDSDIVIAPTTDYQTKRQYFTYSDANDYLNEVYKNGAYRTFGRLDLFDSSSDFTVGETKVELKAKPTPNNTLLNAYPSDTRSIPKFVDASFNYKAPGPRWLYFQENISIASIPAAALMGNYSHNIPELSSLDLNFGQEIPLHPINSTPVDTLYNRYYNAYLSEIYSPESKILEASFMLGVKEIFNLEFNTSIFLFNTYWRILEVTDYVLGGSQPCRVKLIRKLSSVDLPDLCRLIPTAVTVQGLVLWADGDGNSVPGTQGCCEKIGYFWNGVDCRKTSKPTTKPNVNPGGIGGDAVKDPSAVSGVRPNNVALSSGTVYVKDETNTTKNVVASGDNISLLGDNKNTVVVGSDLIVKDGVKDSAVYGTNTTVTNDGLYYGNSKDGTTNSAVWGVIVERISGNYNAALDKLYISEIKLDSNSLYTLDIKISLVQAVAGTIGDTFTHVGTAAIQTDNTGSVISFTDPDNVLTESATAGTWLVGLDSGVTPTTIVVYIQSVSGLTYPSNDWAGSVSITLTQTKI